MPSISTSATECEATCNSRDTAPFALQATSHLQNVYKYLARNPVEARLCGHCEDWPWSSYAGTVGLAEPHSFVDPMRVLESFDRERELAASRLRAFVDEP